MYKKDVLDMIENITSLSDFESKYFYILDNVHGDEFLKIKKEVQIFLLSDFYTNYKDYHGLLEKLSKDDCNDLQEYILLRIKEVRSECVKCMYMFALLNLRFKSEKFGRDFNELFECSFSLFENLINSGGKLEIDFLCKLFLHIIDFSAKTGLKKDYVDNIYNLIVSLNMDICVCGLLVNERMLNNFSDKQKLGILSHLFGLVKSEIVNFSDDMLKEIILSPFIVGFFNNSLDFLLRKCDAGKKDIFQNLQYEIADFTINYIERYLSIGELNSFKNLRVLKDGLRYAKYHKDKKSIRNNIMLNIINLSPALKGSLNREQLSISLSLEQVEAVKKQQSSYSMYSTKEILLQKTIEFFKLAEKSYGKENNEFHSSMIFSQIMLDESGLPIGSISTDEDIYAIKLRDEIFFVIVWMMKNDYEVIREKDDFKEFLLDIKIFNGDEDKHIRKSMQDFIEKDYYGFVTRCIPLIEKRLRLILRMLGEADIVDNDIKGFDYRPIKSFMSSEVVAQVFSKPIQFMFQIIFDDRRGFNLRNKVAHGIVEADEIQLFHALLVLFTLIFLSNLKFELVSN